MIFTHIASLDGKKEIWIPVIRNFFSREPKETLVIVKCDTSEVTYQIPGDAIQIRQNGEEFSDDGKLSPALFLRP